MAKSKPNEPNGAANQSASNASDALIEFGKAVRKLRDRKNLKQNQLAALVGTSQSLVSQIENGKADEIKKQLSGLSRVVRWLRAELKVGTADKKALLDNVCEALNLELDQLSERSEPLVSRSYCPNPECSGAVFVPQGTRASIQPANQEIISDDEPSVQHCRVCGNRLVHECPDCERPIQNGCFCVCGRSYVSTPPQLEDVDRRVIRTWCEKRNAENRRYLQMMKENDDDGVTDELW